MLVAEFHCKVCGVLLCLDNEIVTKRGKMIPMDTRTSQPHPQHPKLETVMRNRPRLPFSQAFGKKCYICKRLYSASEFTDCPDCYENVDGDIPRLKTDRCFLSPLFSSKALAMWAKKEHKKLPLRIIREYLSNSS